MSSNTLVFYVNGEKIQDSNVDPEFTLGRYLREKLGLRGTKQACEEGACGSCTVAVSHYDVVQKKPRYAAVNACLVPIFNVHGCAVTTVEGVGSIRNGLHPIQERLAKGHGSQCGFCTPGFVMSFYALIRNNPEPTNHEIELALEGNICRCTGYRPILEAFYSFGKECGAENCCQAQGGGKSCCGGDKLVDKSSFVKYDPTQDPIFPSELQLSEQLHTTDLELKGSRVTAFVSATQESLFKTLQMLKEQNVNTQLIGSGAMTGLIERGGSNPHKAWVSVLRIQDWKEATLAEDGLEVGSARTINGLQCAIEDAVSTVPAEKAAIYRGLLKGLNRVGSVQLRNSTSWVGNLAGASPVSDITVSFLAARCIVCCVKPDGTKRYFKLDPDKFTGKWPQKFAISTDEVISKVIIPSTEQNEYFQTYKQTLRRGADGAIANAAFYVEFLPGTNIINEIRLAFGGMSNRPVLAEKTAQLLQGKAWDRNLLDAGIESILEELKLDSSAPGGRIEYRNSLCLTFFLRFFTETGNWLHSKDNKLYSETNDDCLAQNFDESVKPTLIFNQTPDGQLDDCGRPLMHQSADKHATGEAQYCADLVFNEMVHLALVQSSRPHAKIKSVDPSEALKLEGVIGFCDVKDIPAGGTNIPGPQTELIIPDNKTVFADGVVTSEGHTIAAIAATDVTTARRAARLVKVEYEDVKPLIVTIEEAIAADSFFGPPLAAAKGDTDKAIEESELTLSGEIYVGSQEHFYMETQCSVIRPMEEGEWEVWSSSQSLSFVQEYMARALGIPSNRIACKAKRIGGAFGGKGFQFTEALYPAAIMANKLKRPVKCYLSRREDMLATGGRHPMLAKYKVGFTKFGILQALYMDLYSNAGDTVDFSAMITFVAAGSMDSCYNIPAGKVTGRACKTNTRSNTAMRGAGKPQADFIIDAVVDRIAQHLNKPAEQIRQQNFSTEGYLKLSGEQVIRENLQSCWDECLQWSEFQKKKAEVELFNKEHKWRKRGVSIVPERYAMGHGGFFEQGGALVNIYMDGTVLISHGGVEMGQGLNIKCLQIASRALRLPIEKITILDTDTSKVPNTVPTGGSMGSDVFGLAIKDACETLLKRMEPIMREKPKGTWEEWCKDAFMNRISLSATGFGIPDRTGIPAHGNRYATAAAAMTLVEIDCLTGDNQILSCDIVMDVGDSLNPAVDIGQIEGGYIQGVGMYTTEELIIGKDGRLVTNSAGNYKVPTVRTVPRNFRVALLKDSPDCGNIYRSKGVGEPPLCLGMGVYFAINEAIKAARSERGLEPLIHLPAPLTVEVIRMACEDKYTKLGAF